MPFRSEKQRRYMWANHPDIAQRWTSDYGSRIEPSGSADKSKGKDMPKASSALKGPIRKGTGKAMIAEAGGGRKALKTWRSLSTGTRKSYRRAVKSGAEVTPILDMMKNLRTQRGASGMNPTTGAKKPGKMDIKSVKRQFKTATKKAVPGKMDPLSVKRALGSRSSAPRMEPIASKSYSRKSKA